MFPKVCSLGPPALCPVTHPTPKGVLGEEVWGDTNSTLRDSQSKGAWKSSEWSWRNLTSCAQATVSQWLTLKLFMSPHNTGQERLVIFTLISS